MGTAEAERREGMWAQNEQMWGWFSVTREPQKVGERGLCEPRRASGREVLSQTQIEEPGQTIP